MKHVVTYIFLFFCISCSLQSFTGKTSQWHYLHSDESSLSEVKDSEWKSYVKGTEFNRVTWFRADVNPAEGNTLLYLPHQAFQGVTSIYCNEKVIYQSSHRSQGSDYERAEAIIDYGVSHVIPIDLQQDSTIYVRLEPVDESTVSIQKDAMLVRESEYLQILFFDNIGIFAVATILFFIAAVSFLALIPFSAEKNRILPIALLNLTGGFIVTAITPFIWTAFSLTYTAVKMVMIVQGFIPVLIFWFFYTDAETYRKLLGRVLFLHLFVALISIPVILLPGTTGTVIADGHMALMFFTIFILGYVVVQAYSFRNPKGRFVILATFVMIVFFVNDMAKAIGTLYMAEMPTFHFGILTASILSLYILYLEFRQRGKLIQQNSSQLKELSFITSHKLRHPIVNMIGLVQVAEDHEMSAIEKEKWLEMLSLTSKQLDAMVHHMNQLTTIESYKKAQRQVNRNKIEEVILIDDDPINNLVNERFLSAHFSDVKISVFEKPQAGLDYVFNHHSLETVLILLDINMPEMNGFEFLDSLKEIEDRAYVYMLSSSIDDSDIRKSYSYHCVYDYITKPLKKSDLTILSKS